MGVLRSAVVATLVFLPLTGAASEESNPPVTLEVELIRTPPVAPVVANDAQSVTQILHAAIAANDLRRFELALARAREIADGMPPGEARNALHRTIRVYSDVDTVWSFAENDRFGAFYDDDALPGLHDRLASDYPGYAAFIAKQSIVDRNGRTFFPTAETRAFLLKEVSPVPRPHQVPAHRIVYLAKARTTQPVKPVPHAKPAAVIPVVTDVLAKDIAKAAPPTVVAATTHAQATTTLPEEAAVAASPGGASIFFIVLALIAAGVVTLFVRTPREGMPRITPTIVEAPPPQAEPTVVVRESSERIA